MKSKLTLSIDKETIEKSRRLAESEKKSLSAKVEELLNNAIDKDTERKLKIIEELHGMFGSVPEDTDWKEMVREAAYEKYGK